MDRISPQLDALWGNITASAWDEEEYRLLTRLMSQSIPDVGGPGVDKATLQHAFAQSFAQYTTTQRPKTTGLLVSILILLFGGEPSGDPETNFRLERLIDDIIAYETTVQPPVVTVPDRDANLRGWRPTRMFLYHPNAPVGGTDAGLAGWKAQADVVNGHLRRFYTGEDSSVWITAVKVLSEPANLLEDHFPHYFRLLTSTDVEIPHGLTSVPVQYRDAFDTMVRSHPWQEMIAHVKVAVQAWVKRVTATVVPIGDSAYELFEAAEQALWVGRGSAGRLSSTDARVAAQESEMRALPFTPLG